MTEELHKLLEAIRKVNDDADSNWMLWPEDGGEILGDLAMCLRWYQASDEDLRALADRASQFLSKCHEQANID